MSNVTMTVAQAKDLREAIDIGLDAAVSQATEYHDRMRGHRPERHEEYDRDVAKVNAAGSMLSGMIAAAQAPATQPMPRSRFLPVEATRSMLDAGRAAAAGGGDTAEVYRAMVDAAHGSEALRVMDAWLVEIDRLVGELIVAVSAHEGGQSAGLYELLMTRIRALPAEAVPPH